jgi:quercetin dioxygenase-like cupin family protein
MGTGQGSVKIVPLSGRKRLNVLGADITCIVSGADTGGAYAMVEEASRPYAGPPVHNHSREDEGFYVLEGEYEVHLGDQVIRATPGSFVFAPRGIPHTFQCVGTKPGKIHVTISPAGFERFLEEISELASAGPPDMQKVIALGGKYGLEFLGPPPGP